MKKKKKFLIVLICLIFLAIIVFGGDSSKEETASSVSQTEATDGSKEEKEIEEVKSETGESGEENKEDKAESGEALKESEEVKTEYHVGDVLQDGDMKIVYIASGEYKEENQFMQPKEGNKLIFIKLGFENQGNSDHSITTFSFECYADGYNAESHYTENDLSATLSPGRTTDGNLVFEVPEDAINIEIEYETNVFTGDKLKFIYDGEEDSGYISEVNTSASANAYSVGDVVELDKLNITYLSCEKDTSYNDVFAPETGKHYVTLKFEFENKGDSDQFVSIYDFDCYADGKNCEQTYYRDDQLSATLSSGRKAQGTVTFIVPDDASVIEAEFVSNLWTSSRVIFTVGE